MGAFMNEAWDGEFIGQIYGEMKEAKMGLYEEAKKQRQGLFTADNIYDTAIIVIKGLMVLLPFMYVFFEMTPKDQAGGSSAGVDGHSVAATRPGGFVGVASMPP